VRVVEYNYENSLSVVYMSTTGRGTQQWLGKTQSPAQKLENNDP